MSEKYISRKAEFRSKKSSHGKMWSSRVSLGHGLVLLVFEQPECETSTPGLVLSSPSLCMVTPGLSPSIRCSGSCSSPGVLGWPSNAVLSTEDATRYLHQREHPTSKLVLSVTKRSVIIVLLQVLNEREQQFSFFTPSFFWCGSHVFLEAVKRLFKFLKLGLFSEKQLLVKSYFRLGFYSGLHVVLSTAPNTYFRLMVIEGV